jgi:hypothetical protein
MIMTIEAGIEKSNRAKKTRSPLVYRNPWISIKPVKNRCKIQNPKFDWKNQKPSGFVENWAIFSSLSNDFFKNANSHDVINRYLLYVLNIEWYHLLYALNNERFWSSFIIRRTINGFEHKVRWTMKELGNSNHLAGSHEGSAAQVRFFIFFSSF